MPKIYRVMKHDGVKPLLGASATTLGVRVPNDILPDVDSSVAPGRGGMFVCPSVVALNRMLARMVPSRLRSLVPGAAGRNELAVWSFWDGQWEAAEQTLAAGLQLRPDPKDASHGFVEPDGVVPLAIYQAAIEATQNFWRLDEA